MVGIHKKYIERPNVFSYLDYRNFLNDLVTYLRSEGRFTARSFAEKAGFRTCSFLNTVIAGKSKVSRESALKMANAFELEQGETDFFLRLVDFAQAKTLEAKEIAYRDLARFTAFKNFQSLEKDKYSYFSKWQTAALLEGIGSCLATKNVDQMAAFFRISTREVEEALKTLQALDLIEEKGKYWKRKVGALEIFSEASNFHLQSYHRGMMARALESLDIDGPDKRLNISLTLSVRMDQTEKLRKRLAQLSKELLHDFRSDKTGDAVFQVNLQAFPLGEDTKKDK